MIEEAKQKEIFEDKYQDKLGMTYAEWTADAPDTEEQAYQYCQSLDQELKDTYEEWFSAQGDARTELENYRDRLKLEYDLIEDMFGLELDDK